VLDREKLCRRKIELQEKKNDFLACRRRIMSEKIKKMAKKPVERKAKY
jgi:hypothetical protein